MARLVRAAFLTGTAVLIVLAFALLASCAAPTAGPSPTGTPSAPGSPTPDPTATLGPIPTNWPSPTSSPDDRVLPAGLYAVLKGEGALYEVFDDTGTWVRTFQYVSATEDLPPAGLFTEAGLSRYVRVNQDDVQVLYPTPPTAYPWDDEALFPFANGFFQRGYQDNLTHVVLYDRSGRPLRTLAFPFSKRLHMIGVSALGDLTAVYFQQSEYVKNKSISSCDFVLLDAEGRILKRFSLTDVDALPWGLVGRKWLVYQTGDGLSILDENGGTLMSGILLEPGETWVTRGIAGFEDAYPFLLSDYFTKDGIVYGADLEPVPPNQADAAGALIPGVLYDVDGVRCTALTESLAIGTSEGRMVVRQGVDVRSFASADETFVAALGDAYLLRSIDGTAYRAVGKADGRTRWTLPADDQDFAGAAGGVFVLSDAAMTRFRFVSADTGKTVRTSTGDERFSVGDSCLLVYTRRTPVPAGEWGWGEDPRGGLEVFDASGALRYRSDTDLATTTLGPHIVLYRGPYAGIADLDGNWILKSLRWNLTRD